MSRNVALVYIRVSRLDEEERGRKVSPEMQREKVLALREIDGLTTEVFEDLDISGKDTAHRPQYLAMMRRLEAGDVRYVAAYDQSRVTRDLGDLQHFRRSLAEHGAQFIEASTGRVTDPHDEDQELSSNVLGSVDQHYRKKVQRRVRDALATKVAHGELVGPVPAGYVRRRELTPDGTKVARLVVEADPERAPIIQLAFRDYATGAYSLKSLAKSLDDRGVPMPRSPHLRNNRAPAHMWTADVLKDILSNSRYVGRIPRRDGTVFPAAFPALIDGDTWAACERVRLRQRTSVIHMKGTPKGHSRYLLSGVLRCGSCGSTMSGETWKPDRGHPTARYRYTCYLRRVAGKCAAPYVRQEELELDVRAILETIALPKGYAEAIDAAVAVYFGQEGRKSRKQTLKTLEERQRRLNDMYELGRVEASEYRTKCAELDEQKANLKTQRPEPVLVRQRTMLSTLVEDWDEMTAEERRRVVGTVFAEIYPPDAEGRIRALPRDDWKPYMAAVLREPMAVDRWGTERKTGVKHAEVVTARLVQDERGWLRLAG